jgi:very-short-patch-repair endonuclease
VITRAQLLALGFTTKAVKHRVARGRLRPVYRGVYAVGRPQLSRKGQWMAAILACGSGAALSHGSAAALWKFGDEWRGTTEISTRRRGWPQRHGLLVRARPSLPAADVVSCDRIPCTSPLRTLLDLATVLGLKSLERAVNEADSLDLVDPERMRRWLEHRTGEPGAPALRTLLDRDTFRLSDTELEVLFRPLALAAGLPQPLTKVIVNDFEVDFFWPQLGLVVETDSLRYHRTAAKQARDLLRDQTHVANGLTPLRFNHHQIKYEPRHVRAVLAATAARLSAQAGSLGYSAAAVC